MCPVFGTLWRFLSCSEDIFWIEFYCFRGWFLELFYGCFSFCSEGLRVFWIEIRQKISWQNQAEFLLFGKLFLHRSLYLFHYLRGVFQMFFYLFLGYFFVIQKIFWGCSEYNSRSGSCEKFSFFNLFDIKFLIVFLWFVNLKIVITGNIKSSQVTLLCFLRFWFCVIVITGRNLLSQVTKSCFFKIFNFVFV